ncbi:hypothetical protein ACFWGP_07245 [Agromyces sp. NPDC127015]|uniref:hypothetical protein n=1 Tax=Agromyces sp. NPDC127015 TaxID=3347108 RepID=UPI00365C5C6C
MSISRPIATALAAAGLAGVLVFGLSACSPEPAPKPSPTPSASAEPIFASDEEALAAAVKAYEAFEELSYTIAADGGKDPGRIEQVATPRYSEQLEAEFAQYLEAGIHADGETHLGSYELVEYDERGDRVEVSLYLCSDVTDVRVLDEAGADVTPEDRRDVTPLQAFLVGDDEHLLVDKVDLWSGTDFC